MPFTAVTPGYASRTSVVPTPTAALVAVDAANGNSVINDGNTVLHFTNTNAATFTAVVAQLQGVDGNAAGSKSYIVPVTTGDLTVGPFPPSIYGSTLSITYTGTTTNGKIAAQALAGN